MTRHRAAGLLRGVRAGRPVRAPARTHDDRGGQRPVRTLTMNPQALHLDAAWSAGQPFGQRLVNSMMTLAVLVGSSSRPAHAGHDRRQPRVHRRPVPAPALPRGHPVRVDGRDGEAALVVAARSGGRHARAHRPQPGRRRRGHRDPHRPVPVHPVRGPALLFCRGPPGAVREGCRAGRHRDSRPGGRGEPGRQGGSPVAPRRERARPGPHDRPRQRRQHGRPGRGPRRPAEHGVPDGHARQDLVRGRRPRAGPVRRRRPGRDRRRGGARGGDRRRAERGRSHVGRGGPGRVPRGDVEPPPTAGTATSPCTRGPSCWWPQGRTAGPRSTPCTWTSATSTGSPAEASDAAASRFTATACVQPSHVPVVRTAYRPTDTEVEWARGVLAAAVGLQHVPVGRAAGRRPDPQVHRARLRRAEESVG